MNIIKYGGVQSFYNTKTNNILNILLNETFFLYRVEGVVCGRGVG